MDDILKLVNVYAIYYKNLYGKALFDGIDTSDISSTNMSLENFYDEIERHKTAKNDKYTDIYTTKDFKKKFLKDGYLPTDTNTYLMIVDNKRYVTHSLISALSFISKIDYCNSNWSINKINEF